MKNVANVTVTIKLARTTSSRSAGACAKAQTRLVIEQDERPKGVGPKLRRATLASIQSATRPIACGISIPSFTSILTLSCANIPSIRSRGDLVKAEIDHLHLVLFGHGDDPARRRLRSVAADAIPSSAARAAPTRGPHPDPCAVWPSPHRHNTTTRSAAYYIIAFCSWLPQWTSGGNPATLTPCAPALCWQTLRVTPGSRHRPMHRDRQAAACPRPSRRSPPLCPLASAACVRPAISARCLSVLTRMPSFIVVHLAPKENGQSSCGGGSRALCCKKVSNRELATDMMQRIICNRWGTYPVYARRRSRRHLIRKYVVVLQQTAGNLFVGDILYLRSPGRLNKP